LHLSALQTRENGKNVLQHAPKENGGLPPFSERYQIFRATRVQHDFRILFSSEFAVSAQCPQRQWTAR
jgi:hypothetical protein